MRLNAIPVAAVMLCTVEHYCPYLMAGEEGFEPSNAGIKIQCLNQLGDSPTQLVVYHKSALILLDALESDAKPNSVLPIQ
jgi:hypothetical protein